MATIDIKLKSYDELQFEIMNLITRNYLLQQKIDKAIEYIRSNEWAKDYEVSNCRTHLLEILGDKE